MQRDLVAMASESTDQRSVDSHQPITVGDFAVIGPQGNERIRRILLDSSSRPTSISADPNDTLATQAVIETVEFAK